MKNNILTDFILFTVVPFIIPFLSEIPDDKISPSVKWVIIICAIIVDFFFAYKSLIKNKKEENKEYIYNSIRYAYSGAHEIAKRKRDNLSHEIEFNMVNIKDNILPYDIHSHISDICEEFKKIISTITKVNTEYISISFIYRYTYPGCSDSDQQWKWLGGREPIKNFELNQFIHIEDTMFYNIIDKDKHYIFGNDKIELSIKKEYHLGTRDAMHDNIGSAFAIKLAFGENSNTLVEGIISVTTHGMRFDKNMIIDNAPNILKNMIINEIFPYYRYIFEIELGLLYLRHINK